MFSIVKGLIIENDPVQYRGGQSSLRETLEDYDNMFKTQPYLKNNFKFIYDNQNYKFGIFVVRRYFELFKGEDFTNLTSVDGNVSYNFPQENDMVDFKKLNNKNFENSYEMIESIDYKNFGNYEFYTPTSGSTGIDLIDEFFENNIFKCGIFKVFIGQ